MQSTLTKLKIQKNFKATLLILVFLGIIFVGSSCDFLINVNEKVLDDNSDDVEIVYNPYKNLDLSSENQYKAALHFHVREDYDTVDSVVKKHIDYGFDILARTEKDELLIPDNDKIFVVPAYESTNDQIEHSIVLFPEDTGNYVFHDEEGAIQWRAHPHDPGRDKYQISEIADQFRDYDSLIGLEIISRNYSAESSEETTDIHEMRRGKGNYIRAGNIWSKMLTDSNVDRYNIFALGVTDGYNNQQIDIGDSIYNSGWTRIVMDNLTEKNMKKSLKKGHFFFVSNMDNKNSPPPIVTNIDIIDNQILLDIKGEYQNIYWFYGGEVISKGNSFNLDKASHDQRYVRFEIWTNESDYWPEEKSQVNPEESAFYRSNIVGSQPFILNDF